MYRLSTDVGGTFSHGVLLDEHSGRVVVSKVASTPHNPAIGTIESIEKFSIPLRDVSFLSHGTPVVINALIEGKGANRQRRVLVSQRLPHRIGDIYLTRGHQSCIGDIIGILRGAVVVDIKAVIEKRRLGIGRVLDPHPTGGIEQQGFCAIDHASCRARGAKRHVLYEDPVLTGGQLDLFML